MAVSKKTNTAKKKGFIAKKDGYSVAIRYSEKSIKEKLIKFIPDHKGVIEISVEDIVNLLAKHVNTDVLAPMIIHNNAIRMIRVARQMRVRFEKDFKAGEEVAIPFEHMMPIEFAIAEEALGVSQVSDKVKKINKKEYQDAEKRVNKQVMDFAKEQHSALIKKQAVSQETS